MSCPNCESSNTPDYLFEESETYAFTICHDCDEEYEDESQLEDEDD